MRPISFRAGSAWRSSDDCWGTQQRQQPNATLMLSTIRCVRPQADLDPRSTVFSEKERRTSFLFGPEGDGTSHRRGSQYLPAMGLSSRSLPPLPWYVTGQARTQEDYASFLGAVAGQPTSAPLESSPGIRASLLTRAKFFRHEHSCRSPRGDTQLLRFSVIRVSTFYPPGHCYAQARG